MAETTYVLESFYETPRGQVAEIMRSLLAMGSIVVVDRDVLLRAFEVYEVDRLISPRPTWWRARRARVLDGSPPSIEPSTGCPQSIGLSQGLPAGLSRTFWLSWIGHEMPQKWALDPLRAAAIDGDRFRGKHGD